MRGMGLVRGSRPFVLVLLTSVFLVAGAAWGGPPFLTDDPEPVETGHWEFYGAFQWEGESHAASGTCPHIEVNYGALPGLQLHAIVPAVLSWTRGGAARFGLGDLELGAKFRFLDEGEWRPQIGVFPLIFLPTGSKERGLGAGAVEAFLPVWIQKSFGPWTTYGGGGIRLAVGGDAAVAGWLVQRQLSRRLTLGVETFLTAPFDSDAVQTQLNTGLIVDLTARHHLLLSAGPSFGSDVRAQAYLAYQLTL
jgi:hypothetical protein